MWRDAGLFKYDIRFSALSLTVLCISTDTIYSLITVHTQTIREGLRISGILANIDTTGRTHVVRIVYLIYEPHPMASYTTQGTLKDYTKFT